MSKKKARPKHAPLKPTIGWAVVDNVTGEIVLTNNESQLFICPDGEIPASHECLVRGDRAQLVLIIKA